jgi:predicted DNA-binding transcriptional regulator YafY
MRISIKPTESRTYKWMVKARSVESETKYTGTPKMERLFKAIDMMTKDRYTVNTLSRVLGVDVRTVYRYFVLLDKIGFKVEKQLSYYKLRRDVYPEFIKAILTDERAN